MPEDYQDLVLATYRKKCEERKLHLNLLKPTVVKLKKECIKKYDASDEAKDVFSDFFDKDKMDDISLILSKADPGDFRPLLNHINGATKRTDEKNSELLAWLIDFQPRPSTTYYTSFDRERENEIEEIIDTTDDKSEEPKNEITGNNDKDEQKLESGGNNIIEELDKKNEVEKEIEKSNTSKPINETENKERAVKSTISSAEIKGKDTGKAITVNRLKDPVYETRFSPRYITISCIILLFVGTTSFAIWERNITSVKMPEAGEKFMYWNEDHYEPVKDDKQNVGAPIIPLNVQTLTQQRKINLPDTLTSYSIGKVWYKGRGKDHEFFTAAGVYPPDTVRTLKKLSTGILRDHISYYRYWHTRLAWFLCATFFISLCGFAVSKLEKEVITKDDSGAQDTQAVLPLEEEPLVEQTEGSLVM